MLFPTVLSYAAAYFSLIMAVAVLLHDRKSTVHQLFAGGMFLFAAEQFFRGMRSGAILPDDVVFWQRWVIVVSALIPAAWIAFSISYARVNPHKALSNWKWFLLSLGIVPVAFVSVFWQTVFVGPMSLVDAARWFIPLGWAGRIHHVFALLTSVLVVFNLERTIRSSTGRMRWQIKFMALGVGGLFALRVYVSSESLLFSHVDTGFGTINALALIAANVLFALSLSRARSLNVDVYLSTATIQNSLTLILAGLYLLSVGVLAQMARYVSGASSLPLDALVVFLSLTTLGVLLLSNRLRRRMRLFVTRHFRRPSYDYRRVWLDLTQRTTSLVDAHELSTAASRMISESLEVLSVSVWLVDDSQRRLILGGSTAFSRENSKEIEKAGKKAFEIIEFLRDHPGCVDLDDHQLLWPIEIMESCPELFKDSRMRYAIGLQVGKELVGVLTLNNDRVGVKTLDSEDLILLETLAAQLAASLLNLKLSERLRHAKEVETFQTVSTFFVHDLKNLASRLSLTMHNLPDNFDNPEFRADALRVIASSVSKVDNMCDRLALLQENIELKLGRCDLNQLVSTTLDEFKGHLKAELKTSLQPVPNALIDSEQIHKVLTNLVMNASEAVNGNGVIQVSTVHEGTTIGFSVRDNGCGMSGEFIEKSLFKPFQTTKKRGLGIGLFHSKLIVEAHHGSVEVSSAVGNGTEFRVTLPIG